jgi:hypothetical protein
MADNSSGGADRGGAPVMVMGGNTEKPKGLLDAISDFEYIFTQEVEKGLEMPPGLLTTKERLMFTELGFRSTFASGLVTALLTPITIGVLEKIIPVFGSSTPTAYDNMFVLILTLFYQIMYACFLGHGVRCYYREYSHLMVKSLLSGITMAAVIKAGIAFILFHFIYIVLLTEHNLVKLVAILSKFIGIEKLYGPYKWLLEFRSVFPYSAWFVVLSTLLWLGVIYCCYISAGRRNARFRENGI